MQCGENLFVKRFLPAPLSKNFYIMPARQLPLPSGHDIEFLDRRAAKLTYTQ